MTIPVDEDGYVPEAELLKHYKQYTDMKQRQYDERRREAAEKGRRLPAVDFAQRDYDRTSNDVIPLHCTPAQVARWWIHPDKCDVEYIDTPGPPQYNVPAKEQPDRRYAQSRIGIIATPSEEAKIRKQLDAHLSTGELTRIANNGGLYQVRYTEKGTAGCYWPSRNVIYINRRNGINEAVVTHESTHMMRHTEPDRKAIVKANKNVAVEESCTVAEQLARSNAPDCNGYYYHVAVYDDDSHVWRRPTPTEAMRMAEEDFMLFTNGTGVGLSSSEAKESVKEHWTESHISRLRYGGPKMAINIAAEQFGFDPVSKAKNAQNATLTNATAGKPGVVPAQIQGGSKSSKGTGSKRARRWTWPQSSNG